MFNLNPKKLHFQAIQTRFISDLLKNCDINKAAGIDDLSGGFLTYSRNNKGPLGHPTVNFCNTRIFALKIYSKTSI